MDLQTAFDGETLSADWVMDGGLLGQEPGLKTAIVLSLFTDRRAEPGDALPDGSTDRRGWWGDVVSPVNAPPGVPWRSGSRLWLLSREKQTAETAARAEDYCREALDWLTRLGVAARVDAAAEWKAMGVLGLLITVTKADGATETFGWLWTATTTWQPNGRSGSE